MKCAICRNGITEKRFITITLKKNNTIWVFKRVPAEICDNCGEEYISSETNKKLLACARDETTQGVHLEVLEFAA